MDLTPEQQSRYEYAKDFFNYTNKNLDPDLNKLVQESAAKVKELQDDLQSLINNLDSESVTFRER